MKTTAIIVAAVALTAACATAPDAAKEQSGPVADKTTTTDTTTTTEDETTTETVEVELTSTGAPSVCLVALDQADVIIDEASQIFVITGEFMDAAVAFDVDEMSRLADELETHVEPYQNANSSYQVAAIGCRGL